MPENHFYSDAYDDIYFSPEDGLAETRHVFLEGNDVERALSTREAYHVAEMGFGTGLNFFALCEAHKNAESTTRITFTTVEKHPVSAKTVQALATSWPPLKPWVDAFLAHYHNTMPQGHHCITLSPHITLNVWIGDAATCLPQWDTDVDAWFLDGFAPKKNPDMWSDILYCTMRRLSKKGTTAATFTVAGHVRRGIESAGFEVVKTPGFGNKKQMSKAIFTGTSHAA